MATRLDVAPFAKSDVYALNRRIRSVQAEIDVIDHRLVGEEFQFGPLRSLRDEKVRELDMLLEEHGRNWPTRSFQKVRLP